MTPGDERGGMGCVVAKPIICPRANLMGFASFAPSHAVLPDAGAAVQLVRAGYDAEEVDVFCRGEGWLDDMEAEVYVEADKVR
jgi:hypothetical protein